MNDYYFALKTAILTRDCDRLQALAIGADLEVPRDVRSELVNLAARTGDARIETRATRLLGTSTTPDWADLLIRYIGDISEDSSAAQWLQDIEYWVWAAALGIAVSSRANSPVGDMGVASRDDLVFLSQRAHGWASWDDDAAAPVHVSADAWRNLFSAWLAMQSSAD